MGTPDSTAPFRTGRLAQLAIVLYLLQFGLCLATLLTCGWLEYRFLHRTVDAVPPILAWVVVLQPVLAELWWLRFVLVVAGNGLLMACLYRDCRELARRGATLRYEPYWAVLGWFVPVLNFVRPYQVARDALRAAALLQDRPPAAPWIVHAWWAAVWMNIVMNAIGGRSVLPGHLELDPFLVLSLLASAATSLASAALLLRLERDCFDPGLDRPGTVAPKSRRTAWQLGLAGSLATLLVLAAAFGQARLGLRRMAELGSAGIGSVPPGWGKALPPPEASPPPSPLPRPAAPPREGLQLVQPIQVPDGVQGGVPGGVPGGVVGGILGSPAPAPTSPRRVQVAEAALLQGVVHRVEPMLPHVARAARVSGSVTLAVVVSPEGGVQEVRVVLGHPLLAQAASAAVRQWRFRPRIQDGKPVEQEGTIKVRMEDPSPAGR